MAIDSELSHQKWGFSIVMLNYQRVIQTQRPVSKRFKTTNLPWTELTKILWHSWAVSVPRSSGTGSLPRPKPGHKPEQLNGAPTSGKPVKLVDLPTHKLWEMFTFTEGLQEFTFFSIREWCYVLSVGTWLGGPPRTHYVKEMLGPWGLGWLELAVNAHNHSTSPCYQLVISHSYWNYGHGNSEFTQL